MFKNVGSFSLIERVSCRGHATITLTIRGPIADLQRTHIVSCPKANWQIGVLVFIMINIFHPAPTFHLLVKIR